MSPDVCRWHKSWHTRNGTLAQDSNAGSYDVRTHTMRNIFRRLGGILLPGRNPMRATLQRADGDFDFAFVLTGSRQVVASCICNHVSGVLPKALDSLIAISGLMPDLPFTTLLRACRVTPSIFAAAVTESFKGSRQSCRTMRPDAWGFSWDVFFSLSNGNRSAQRQRHHSAQSGKRCANWPYRHGPQPPQVAFEWVQAVAGEIQSLSVVAESRTVRIRSTVSKRSGRIPLRSPRS